MKLHRRVDFFSNAAFMNDGDGRGKPSNDERSKKPPISEDAYNRIPDEFKRPARDQQTRRDNDGKNNGGEPPQFPEPPRRPSTAVVVFSLAVAATLLIGYRSFFTPKVSEITWTAFNRLLDEGRIVSAELRGKKLAGSFRDEPKLTEWPYLIPDGERMFATAVAQYDRAHPNVAQTLNAELDDEFNKIELRVTRPTAPNDGETVSIVMANKETNEVYRSQELPGTATDDEIAAVKREFAESYRLCRQIDQRWELKPVNAGRFNPRQASQMIDRKTQKPFDRVFFNRYECEVPDFAYADGSLDKRLRDSLKSYESIPQTDNSMWLTLLSIGVTVVFFVFLFRMMRSARDTFIGGNPFGATRSLAKKYDPDSAKRATFDDVAGMDQVKAELVEVVDFLKNPEKYERMGARVPRGTLLFGPPGTGKTLLARAVAGEAGVPFFSINGSEFIQMFVGVGASRVRDLFSTARENAPSILFIDEIDAVGRQRGAGVGGGQDEREQTLNQILSEMDGFTQTDSVMVMASTNRPDVLDPALMRPGRFDRHITVGRPSMRGRVDIFKVYLKKIPCGNDVDVQKLAAQTAGFTGADIRNYVNEATLWATRNDKNLVEASDFDFAFEKIALGLKRDEIITPENKRKTAVHEAGHAVVGWFLPAGSKVHKVTIIPRGQALGVTWSLPEEDRLSYDASEARASLAHLLAGRVAEKIVYGETTSGVENDLQRATDLARDMVARWGMSDRLGPVSFPNTETHPFLGREMSTGERVYSEATAELIDSEIKRIVLEADKVAEDIILSRREMFDQLVDALTAEEELDRPRLVEILGPAPNDNPEADDAETDQNDVASAENVSTPVDPQSADSGFSFTRDPWNLPDPLDSQNVDSDDFSDFDENEKEK